MAMPCPSCHAPQTVAIAKETLTLFEELKIPDANQYCSLDTPQTAKNKGKGCGRGRNICPADVRTKLDDCSKNTDDLERHFGELQGEIKGIIEEMVEVKKERKHLEHHRKMLCPPPICTIPKCVSKKVPANCNLQLKEQKEKYNKLQDDFKSKLIEVSGLRVENEKLKEMITNAEEEKKSLEDKLQELEEKIKTLTGDSGSSEGGLLQQITNLQQQLKEAKEESQKNRDEADRLQDMNEDQQVVINEYKNQYMEAQQEIEDQKRQIDLIEVENKRVSEQVSLEIQRVKNRFQEKIQELTPLPRILKECQRKLQEVQQMHLLAERNNAALERELQMYKEKLEVMNAQVVATESDPHLELDEIIYLKEKVEVLEHQLAIITEERDISKSLINDMKVQINELQNLADNRLNEIVQLENQLESLTEGNSRLVGRMKERAEVVRKSLQSQIFELERQIAYNKSIAKTAQKDRNNLRNEMQIQIDVLRSNFDDAQMRVKTLQAYADFLKNQKNEEAKLCPPCEVKIPTKVPCSCDK